MNKAVHFILSVYFGGFGWQYKYCPYNHDRINCRIWNCPAHFVNGKYSKKGQCNQYYSQKKKIELLEKHICELYGMIADLPRPDYLPELMDCNTCTDKGYCPDCPDVIG